jgi:hypothetical protein
VANKFENNKAIGNAKVLCQGEIGNPTATSGKLERKMGATDWLLAKSVMALACG